MSESDEPFQRDEYVDEPGIGGARWWQEDLADGASRQKTYQDMQRRQALLTVLGIGAGVAVVAGIIAAERADSAPAFEKQPRKALEMQRAFGWAFGAATEPLTWDGANNYPYSGASLGHLQADCTPSRPELLPLFVTTIFEAPTSRPTRVTTEDPQTFVPLSDVLKPVRSASIDLQFARGRALGDLFARAMPKPSALVLVDLPGDEAVAFAAGASPVFDPVFLFDNWPHPRAVVPAHQPLGALAYWQPLFAKHRSLRAADAYPMLVLDRERLRFYGGDPSRFDNRHLARLPTVAMLKKLGITHVLYVVPLDGGQDLDDANDWLVSWSAAGIDVRMVGASVFATETMPPPTPSSTPTLGTEPQITAYYGGRHATHDSFWLDYPWAQTNGATAVPINGLKCRSWRPVRRATQFSGAGTGTPTYPPNFGTTEVVVAVGGGTIMGAGLSRTGSWLRSSGG